MYRENFWIATAASAPVIALAAIVAMGQMARVAAASLKTFERHMTNLPIKINTDAKPDLSPEQAKAAEADSTLDLSPEQLKTTEKALVLVGQAQTAMWSTIVIATNVVLQGVVLCFALLSLAAGTNDMPPWIAIAGEMLGLAALAVPAYVVIAAGAWISAELEVETSEED